VILYRESVDLGLFSISMELMQGEKLPYEDAEIRLMVAGVLDGALVPGDEVETMDRPEKEHNEGDSVSVDRIIEVR
jgi:hypothetical protein